MPHTIKQTAYYYHELEGTPKDRARTTLTQWVTDFDWWEFVYELWGERLLALGIDTTAHTSRGPAVNYSIYFSGFWSQGDGACFTGTIDLTTFMRAHKLARQYWPLYLAIKREGYTASISHRGRYYHAYSTEFNFEDLDYYGHFSPMAREQIPPFKAHVEEICRDYMKDLYHDLQKEYEYQTSDENLEEMAHVNEYVFDAAGNVI